MKNKKNKNTFTSYQKKKKIFEHQNFFFFVHHMKLKIAFLIHTYVCCWFIEIFFCFLHPYFGALGKRTTTTTYSIRLIHRLGEREHKNNKPEWNQSFNFDIIHTHKNNIPFEFDLPRKMSITKRFLLFSYFPFFPCFCHKN